MENQDDSQWNEDTEESFYGIGSRALQANPQQPLVTDVSLWPPMSVRNSEHTTCDYQALTTSPPDPSQILGFFGPGSLSNAQFENTMNSSAAGNFDMPFQRQINSVYQPLFNPSFVGIQQYSRLPKEGWTPEQDNLLLTLRREGREYSQIADQMRIDFGIVTSENRLVKRFQKIQDQYLEPLPVAIKNVMPDIMSCIKDEMDKMGLGRLSGSDKDLLDQIIQELPRSIPKFVQNKLTSKRKAMLNTLPTRT